MPYKDLETKRAAQRARYAANSERIQQYLRDWYAEHKSPERGFGMRSNVTAKRHGSMERLDWRNLPTSGPCIYCGLDDATVRWDHVIPLSRGGRNHSSNIVRACPPCNFRKNKRTPEEQAELDASPNARLEHRRAYTREWRIRNAERRRIQRKAAYVPKRPAHGTCTGVEASKK